MNSNILSPKKVDQLETFLFSPALEETAMDYYEIVGAVTANLVSPVELSSAMLAELITGQETNATLPKEIQDIILEIKSKVQKGIEQDERLLLPTESGSELESIQNWCSGFCQVYFCSEEQWLSADEGAVAEMMFPILSLSGLMDEDESFIDVSSNDELIESFCDQLPELVLDLYLLFHAK